jgi:hypothetical protein
MDPLQHGGWMWDITGNNDHDFYIDTAVAAILVHNCSATLGRNLRDAGEEPTTSAPEAHQFQRIIRSQPGRGPYWTEWA